MAGAYGVISLSYLIDRYGDDLAKKALEQFVPYADDSTASFLKEKAIPMEKRDLSRTYIAISQKSKKVLGYVTIGMKCIRIPENNCLSKSLLKQCNIEESTGVAQAYLVGQLARSIDTPKGFGRELMNFAIEKLREAKTIVGCRMTRLDCTDELIGYYRGYGFNLIRKNENKNLNQMMIFI